MNRDILEARARLLAKCIGDGCVSQKYFGYTNQNQDLIEEFEQDVQTVFGPVHFGKGTTNSKTNFRFVYRRKLVRKLLEFLPSFRSKDVAIPQAILEGTEKERCEFLRALFDDEGSPTLIRHSKTGDLKRKISITSKSRKLIAGVKEVLEELGITTNKILYYVKKGYKTKIYYVDITGGKPWGTNFIRFQRKVGFKSKSKQKRLEKIVSSYKRMFKKG